MLTMLAARGHASPDSVPTGWTRLIMKFNKKEKFVILFTDLLSIINV